MKGKFQVVIITGFMSKRSMNMYIHEKESCFQANVLTQKFRVTLLMKKKYTKLYMRLDKTLD